MRDFLEVIRRRWHGVHVLVVPVRVQGDGAAEEIAAGVALVNRLAVEVDVLVVGRGGGSLEDLWAFNEEVVVRAIHASRIPVVSAVGHEIDVTLSDLVADVRALTPSEAAERIVPAAEEVRAYSGAARRTLAQRALARRATATRARLDALAACRAFRRPLERVRLAERGVDELDARLRRGVARRVEVAQSAVAQRAGRLESLSPLAVLQRGYSLTTRDDGRPLGRAAQAAPGERVRTRLADGQFTSRVESVESLPETGDSSPP